MKTKRDFLELALAQLNKPYIWGAKGPDRFDCSGLVTWCLKELGGPDWRQSHSSARLFDKLPSVPLDQIQPGDLALYGPPHKVTHVMIVSDYGTVIGASNGDSTTRTLDDAKRRKACVKVKPNIKYRPDLRGVRSLEQILQAVRTDQT